jgi:hypothetical protein
MTDPQVLVIAPSEAGSPQSSVARISPLTVVRFLFGSREAIRLIAESPAAVWIGGLFVLSAGFAREYDGEDLSAEPWHLLIPFGASLATSCLLFACAYAAARYRGAMAAPYATLYVRFLGVYWMTAPLAWLYALPVERWTGAAEAVEWNLWLLAIVSVWRVALMIRVVNVLFAAPAPSAAWVVCSFACGVVLVLAWSMPMPVIAFMGGVRLSERDALIQSVMFNLRVAAVLGGLVCFVGLPVFLARSKPAWGLVIDLSRRTRVHPGVWLLPAAALAVWPFVLPHPQREQRLRRQVEEMLVSDRIAEALELMSEHRQDEFPPHWEPPPRIAYARPDPPLLDVMEQVVADPPAEWVREVFVDKLRDRFGDHWGDALRMYWHGASREEQERFVTVMEALPEAREILRPADAEYTGMPLFEDEPAELVERLQRIVADESETTDDGEASP